MKKLTETLQWLDNNQSLGYSVIRLFLGAALFTRGWIFFTDPGAVTELAREETLYMWFSYVTIGHLIGGIFITLGLFTRLAALFQIPILFGAVFVVHADQSFASIGQSLELSVLVLVLLIVLFVFGSGSFSLKKYLAKRRQAQQSDT